MCAQIRLQTLLLEQRRLGGEHLQIAADAGAVARERELVGLPCGRERTVELDALRIDRPQGRQLIHHFAQGIDQRLVVLLERKVVVGVLRGKIAAKAPAVEEGQPQCRAECRNFAAPSQELGEGDALHADERGEIDAGVELPLGRLDVAARGLDAPALRHHVGPPAEEVRRQRRRQRKPPSLHARARDGEAAVGALAEQRRQQVAS